MLRIDKDKKALIALERKKMRESGYWERRDIQEMICRTPEAFCDEIEERIWFVGSEVQPTKEVVGDRIDLLGIDEDGAAVIVEIKRDRHKLQLLQALAYAGMVAKWEPRRFVEELCKFSKKFRNNEQTFDQAKDELEDTLEEGDIEAINRKQRVVLLAEEFDYEVLVTAEWLTEVYKVDIRCYRVALANNGTDDFLTCTRAYPPPELTEIAIRRRKQETEGVEPPANWNEALESIENQAVARFFQQEVAAERPNNPKNRNLRFFMGDRRRFVVSAKRHYARVWQAARFGDDIEFWKSRLGERCRITQVGGGRRLRFYLSDEADFGKFKAAVTTELVGTEFHGADEADEGDETEPASE